jgi:hypothetical protein
MSALKYLLSHFMSSSQSTIAALQASSSDSLPREFIQQNCTSQPPPPPLSLSPVGPRILFLETNTFWLWRAKTEHLNDTSSCNCWLAICQITSLVTTASSSCNRERQNLLIHTEMSQVQRFQLPRNLLSRCEEGSGEHFDPLQLQRLGLPYGHEKISSRRSG